MPRPWAHTLVPCYSPLPDYPVCLKRRVAPLALLFVFQRTFIPLVAGVLPDPVVSFQECTVGNATQDMFPWPIWVHLSVVGLILEGGVSSQASAFVSVYLKFTYKCTILQCLILMHSHVCLCTDDNVGCRQSLGVYTVGILAAIVSQTCCTLKVLPVACGCMLRGAPIDCLH